MISGGAPLAKEIAIFFVGIGVPILEGYGLTETGPVLTINRLGESKPGTVGQALPNVALKVVHGEILAKGPNLMKGYFKNQEATDRVIQDGWFHTGDIGVLDGDQYLRITDRKKDLLITSGGKNIAPQPLENALKLSPLIEQAVVIGDKQNFISALLVPPWDTVADWAPAKAWPDDPKALVDHAPFLNAVQAEVDCYMDGFAHYEKVKKFTLLPRLLSVSENELTPSLKVKRRVVYEKYAQEIDAMYA